ncbi:MAG TPA: hypothetical protein VIA81_03935 [Acidimicrobiia bacterium]
MQFKGALRSPGDRGPGTPVVLVVDEYHLEIVRGSELVGRWYLADVEVVRDIAEKFVLFLGDEEMEFLAEDALQFAYDGVSAMQNAWLRAQKKKRRHRRAAADAARRKDETTSIDEETLDEEPVRKPAAKSELARRLAAVASNDEEAQPPSLPRRQAPKPSVESAGRPTLSARRKKVVEEVAAGRESEEPAPSPVKAVKPRKRQEQAPSTEPAAPPWIAPEPEPEQPRWQTPPARPEAPAPHTTSIRIPIEPVAATPAPPPIRPRRDRREEHPAPAEEPPPMATRRGRRLLPAANGAPALSKPAETPDDVGPKVDAEVRFAPEGHHPAETSTGLLSKLRKQPKLPDDHVHKFVETGSSVGLVRRVCTECSYVSIGNDDEGSTLTRW